MRWREFIGFMRSWIMYYGKPFNRKKLRNFYSQFILQGDIVFDIGAHLGNRSQVFLDLKSNVIAVEPQPIFIHYLKQKFKPDQHFNLIEGVVGNKTEKIKFQINTMSPTISTARDKLWQQSINTYSSYRPPWDSEIETQSYTLDYLISVYGMPQFCKIDTEGFEWEVLQGLHHAIPCLSIEFLAFDLERILLCIEKMSKLDKYKMNFSPGESQTFLWDEWKSVHEVKNILVNNDLDYKFGDLYFKIFN